MLTITHQSMTALKLNLVKKKFFCLSLIYKKKKKEQLFKKWTKSKYQNHPLESVSNMEGRFFNSSKKWDIIFGSLYANNPEKYLSFFVCRDPVERLKSVYKYLRDMFTTAKNTGINPGI